MRITIVCVGKLKEKYLTDAAAEYLKRLTPFDRVEIKEIPEEKMPAEPSAAQKEQVLEKETARLIRAIPDNCRVVVLDVAGRQLSSEEVAKRLDDLAVGGTSHIAFVIGGAFGFTDALRRRADFAWSFSRLTFTHQMIRVMLLEQIYRAEKIRSGQKYSW